MLSTRVGRRRKFSAFYVFHFFNNMKKIKFDVFCGKLKYFLVDYKRIQREHEEKVIYSVAELNNNNKKIL